MHVTDIELIPVEIPTRPLDEELGLAPYVGGPSIGDQPETLSFEEALGRCGDVGTSRQGVLVKLETDAGVTGWGEMPGSARVGRAIVEEAIAPELIGRPAWDIEPFVDGFRDELLGLAYRDVMPYVGGIEMAMWDALGKEAGTPVYRLLGGKRSDTVPVAFCLGLSSPEESREKAREALDHGFSVLKTKASRYWRTDVERIEAMHDEVDGELEFRLDPNTEWNLEDAVRVGAKLDRAGIHLQYLEQPIEMDSFGSLGRLRERLAQPIAVNEDAYLPHHVFHAVKADAIDAAVVDCQPAGGLLGLKRLASLASEANVSLAHHSGHDLGLKNAAKAHAYASTPELNLAFDCTLYAAEDDVLEVPLEIEDGRMTVPEEPGLAGAVDRDAVEEYRTDR